MSTTDARIRIDPSKFFAGLKRTSAAVQKATPGALYRAGIMLMDRALNDAPKPPIEWGSLRGSAAVQVAGGPVNFAGDLGLSGSATKTKKNKKGSPAQILPPPGNVPPMSVRLSFNTEYAARLHESPDWSPNPESEEREPGQIGYKWLSKKVEAHGGEMKDLAAEFLKDALDD